MKCLKKHLAAYAARRMFIDLQATMVSAAISKLYSEMCKTDRIAIIVWLGAAHACHCDGDRCRTAF
jgi:hypothetical protein